MESCLRCRCHWCGGPPTPRWATPPQSWVWPSRQPYEVMSVSSSLSWRTPPPWLAAPPPKLSVMKQAALCSRVCVIVENPPGWLPPPQLADPPPAGWPPLAGYPRLSVLVSVCSPVCWYDRWVRAAHSAAQSCAGEVRKWAAAASQGE